jgi:hypothetical protein
MNHFFADMGKGIGMSFVVLRERHLPDPISMTTIHQTTSLAWLTLSLTMQAMFRQKLS